MTYYLLTWNCKDEEEYRWSVEAEKDCAKNGSVNDRWSCGNTKKIMPGDRVFLLRQSRVPRGIIALGYVTHKPFEAPHWLPERSVKGDSAVYVYVVWERFFAEPVIAEGVLPARLDDAVSWYARKSGEMIDGDVGAAVEKEFLSRITDGQLFRSPDEIDGPEGFAEGAAKTVVVNSYERNPKARAQCLERFDRTRSHFGIPFVGFR